MADGQTRSQRYKDEDSWHAARITELEAEVTKLKEKAALADRAKVTIGGATPRTTVLETKWLADAKHWLDDYDALTQDSTDGDSR